MASVRSAPGSSTSRSRPDSSRRISTTGWMTRSIPYPSRTSSIVTESTMNGMSSETISTTVCGDCHPWCSNSGL